MEKEMAAKVFPSRMPEAVFLELQEVVDLFDYPMPGPRRHAY